MQDMSVHDCMTLHLKMKLCLQFRAVSEPSRSFTVPGEGPSQLPGPSPGLLRHTVKLNA